MVSACCGFYSNLRVHSLIRKTLQHSPTKHAWKYWTGSHMRSSFNTSEIWSAAPKSKHWGVGRCGAPTVCQNKNAVFIGCYCILLNKFETSCKTKHIVLWYCSRCFSGASKAYLFPVFVYIPLLLGVLKNSNLGKFE